MIQVPPNSHLVSFSWWEFDCCGDPMTVGDRVRLALKRGESGSESVFSSWGGSVQAPILRAGHHGGLGEDWWVEVRVERLWEVRARFEQSWDGQRRSMPDSQEVAQVGRMQLDENDWLPARDGGEPLCWFLQIRILKVLETSEGAPPLLPAG